MKKNPVIAIIIQARLGSTRFPAKVLQLVSGKPLLLMMLERVQYSKYGKNIIVATTEREEDNVIAELCSKKNYCYFRGDESDLLDRHLKAAISVNADIAVKIPSDCPLIDPSVIDSVIDYYIEHSCEYDYVSNLHPASYPDGNDVEVIPVNILETAWREAVKPFEREHTTPFIWDNPSRFRIGNVKWDTGLDYSMTHRWTLDYPADYEFIKTVFEELYEDDTFFGLYDILSFLKKNPAAGSINSKYAGMNWYRNHISELKTIDIGQTKEIKQ
jgi:spore coat polysaccharide biosynthesis protein SpsF